MVSKLPLFINALRKLYAQAICDLIQHIICSLLCSIFFPSPATADIKFYVYPIKLEMPVAPGGSLEKEIKVQNQHKDPLTIRTYVMDYEISKNNEFAFYPPGYESYSCARWISLNKADFNIPAGGEETVLVTLNVPKKVEPSGHYAVIFFESVGKELKKGTSGVIAQGRIGTLILQSTPGKEKNKRQH